MGQDAIFQSSLIPQPGNTSSETKLKPHPHPGRYQNTDQGEVFLFIYPSDKKQVL